MTFRRAIYTLLPHWLTSEDGERIAYTLAVIKDWWLQRLRDGLMARFPDYAPDDALALLGRGRKITRGLVESSDNYRVRLKAWRQSHRRRASARMLLEQQHIHWNGFFFANDPLDIALIYRSGRAYELEGSTGTITRSDIPWEPDAEPSRRARWWMIFSNWPDGSVGDDGAWGDPGDWGGGGVWGANLAPITVERLRLIPTEWNAANCIGRIGLLGPGAELWGYPVGTWGDPGVWGGGNYAEIGVH